MKTINAKDIIKIYYFLLRIFEEEDQDYPDRRKIAPKEKAIERILNKTTTDIEDQEQITKLIKNGIFSECPTYDEIFNNIRNLGYRIIN